VLQGEKGLGGDRLGIQHRDAQSLHRNPRFAGAEQARSDLGRAAVEATRVPDQIEDAGLGREIGRLVPMVVEVVLGKVGPSRVAQRNPVQPSLVQSVTACLHHYQVVVTPVLVQQAAQLDEGRGGEAGFHE
jgi:hypothetical protein